WIVVSTSSEGVARRLMEVLDLADDERFATQAGRAQHREEVEAAMAAWCAIRTQAEAIAELTAADAAVGPVLDMADLAADEHVRSRQAITTVGDTPMQALIARLSATPGRLRHEGRPLDADGDDVRRRGWGCARVTPAAAAPRRCRRRRRPPRRGLPAGSRTARRSGRRPRAARRGAPAPRCARPPPRGSC